MVGKLQSYSLPAKAFIISFGKIINRASALFAIIYLSYHLPKEDYGSYRQVWLLFNTLVPVLSLGIPVSVNYFFPLLREEQKKTFIFQTYFCLLILGFLFALLFFLGASGFSVLFNNNQINELMKYFCIIPFLALPTLFYQNLFICLDNPLLATKVSLLSSIFYFIAIVVPLQLGYSIIDMIYCLTIFYLIQFLVISCLYYKIFRKKIFRFNRKLLMDQFKYAIPVGLSSAIGIIGINIDNVFVSTYFDIKSFAEYANGAMELPFIGIITGSIMAVLMPEFVKRYNDKKNNDVIRLWHSSIIKTAVLFFPLMCFLFIFSQELIIIFFSSIYKDGISADIFRIYLLQLPCRLTIFGVVLLSMNQPKFVLKTSLLFLFLNISLNYILIRQEYLSIMGPAVSTVISLYCISLLQLNKIGIKFNLKFSQIFPWIQLAKIIIISVLSGLIIYLVNFKILNLFDNIFLNNLVIVLIGLCSYSILFLFLGFITKTINKTNILNFKQS